MSAELTPTSPEGEVVGDVVPAVVREMSFCGKYAGLVMPYDGTWLIGLDEALSGPSRESMLRSAMDRVRHRRPGFIKTGDVDARQKEHSTDLALASTASL